MKQLNLTDALIAILGAVVIDLILAYLFMLVWNMALPKMFTSANVISYWTAFAFIMLCSIIKIAITIKVYRK